MTNQNVPIKQKPIINKDSVLYLSDLEVELSESDNESNDSVYTEICFNDDLDFDPYYAEDENDDSDDSDDDEVKIFPSEK